MKSSKLYALATAPLGYLSKSVFIQNFKTIISDKQYLLIGIVYKLFVVFILFTI